MYLNTDIIYHYLGKAYSVFHKKTFKNPPLYSPLVYDGQTILSHHIYIIGPDDIPSLAAIEENIAFIYVGAYEASTPVFTHDCIFMRESPESARLLTFLTKVFDYFNQWEQCLNNCSFSYEGLQKMLDSSRKIMGGTLILSDFYFNQVAYTKDFLKYDEYINPKFQGRAPATMIEELLADPEFHRLQRKREVFQYPKFECRQASLCYNLFRQGENLYYGRLMLLSDVHPYSAVQYHLLKFLGDRINRIFSQISVFTFPISVYTNLRQTLKDILNQLPVNTSLAKSTLRELHWNSEDNYLAVVFTSFSPDGMKDVHTMICNQLDLLFLESCTVILDHVAVMVMNTTKNNDYKEGSLHQKLSIFLRENTFKAGISNPVPDFFHLQTAYLEASAALEIGNRKNSTFWYYYFSDYVLDYIINKSSQEIPRNYLSHPAIQKLQEHDLQCGTEYYITLKAYFECQYNSTHAAETLYIHRTTFISRLEKIIAITKLDLNDWNTRLHLMISFTL
jgi:hypothetical protein